MWRSISTIRITSGRERSLFIRLPQFARSARFYHHSLPHSNGPRFRFRVGIAGAIGIIGFGFIISIPILNPIHSESAKKTGTGTDPDERLAVRSKSFSELLLKFIVLQMCTISPLINIAPRVISTAEKIHIEAPIYWLIKNTFFAYFCGGETANECITKMTSLKDSGVGSILDLSMEVDDNTMNPNLVNKIDWDSRADQVQRYMLECIQTASAIPNSFAAVKITALVNPSLLKKMSILINDARQAFEKTGGNMSMNEFLQTFSSINPYVLQSLFAKIDTNHDGKVDLIDFESVISFGSPHFRTLISSESFSDNDIEQYEKLISRIRNIANYAFEKKVSLMIDAEQTYFQPAIDHIAIRLSGEFNKTLTIISHRPTIFTTYQMYLKDAYSRLVMDVERSERNGYRFAAKLVRGAYMEMERKRAKKLGLMDPICENAESTHENYNRGVDFLLNKLDKWIKMNFNSSISFSSPIVFMVASHNRNSIFRILDYLKSKPEILSENVLFGQLLGMCDATTLQLAKQGMLSYKYVPYGPVKDVVPYLVRRATENSSVAGEARREKSLVLREMWHRLKS